MQTIEIQNGIQASFEDVFKGIQELDNQALAAFAGEFSRILSQKKVKTPIVREVKLLQKIKAVIPASIRRRQTRSLNLPSNPQI